MKNYTDNRFRGTDQTGCRLCPIKGHASWLGVNCD